MHIWMRDDKRGRAGDCGGCRGRVLDCVADVWYIMGGSVTYI